MSIALYITIAMVLLPFLVVFWSFVLDVDFREPNSFYNDYAPCIFSSLISAITWPLAIPLVIIVFGSIGLCRYTYNKVDSMRDIINNLKEKK